ncbi:MAG TPA: hypothetical protein VEH50_12990 [Methylomirabilota bacterium]|jgi:hypothetical protein|nr:hypothetical protein [Methylomirabilota bacterium]
MTLKTVTLITAIVNAVALVVSFLSFVINAREMFRGGFEVPMLSNLAPWAIGMLGDAMLVVFLFVLYARQERQ